MGIKHSEEQVLCTTLYFNSFLKHFLCIPLSAAWIKVKDHSKEREMVLEECCSKTHTPPHLHSHGLIMVSKSLPLQLCQTLSNILFL